jgi:hypothetical protein
MARNTHDTREGWLREAVAHLDKKFFQEHGYELPEKVAVSCGFPKGGGSKAIGQCWHPEVAADGTHHLFICPTQDDPVRVLDILLHELIHACVGTEHGHKKPFKDMAREFGLKGKPTATYVPEGTETYFKLCRIKEALGPYPHKKMQPPPKPKGKGGSGWIRMVSPETDLYKVVVSPRMLEEYGAPRDPWGNEMVPKEDQ